MYCSTCNSVFIVELRLIIMKLFVNALVKEKLVSKKKKFSLKLLEWFSQNPVEYPWRKTSSPYHIMISEMLLRRTRASNVIPVYEEFLEKFPGVEILAKSYLKEIEKVVKSLGIKSRSAKIKSVATVISENYKGKVPSGEKEFQEIFGTGSRYTVNAIRCFAFDRKVPIFDVNIERILGRVFSIDFGNDAHKKKQSWEITSLILPDKKIKQFNWAMLELGHSICTSSKPKCSECPLNSICDYAKESS